MYAKDEITNLKEQTENTNKFLLREKLFNLRQYEEELKVEDIIKTRSIKVCVSLFIYLF